MKRLFDLAAATALLLVSLPFVLLTLLLVWIQDRRFPLYLAPRVGRHGEPFQMAKIRSMVADADASHVDSTSANDVRVTAIGRFIRRYKIDEITQLWNVIRGEMSFVGPRPNVARETTLYTAVERRLLEVTPGITDFASIVFADLGDILKDRNDPNIAYNQLVRPAKSALGLFYIDHLSFETDMRLCWLTVLSVASRSRALAGVERLLRRLGASDELIRVASRRSPLTPMPPPGASAVVTTRAQHTLS